MPNIEENPDFQLLKQFLQSINPNDMDEASATELMDLGKMIQNGGALTDRQREMFASVVGAMPDMGMRPGMQGSVSDTEMGMYKDSLGQGSGIRIRFEKTNLIKISPTIIEIIPGITKARRQSYSARIKPVINGAAATPILPHTPLAPKRQPTLPPPSTTIAIPTG